MLDVRRVYEPVNICANEFPSNFQIHIIWLVESLILHISRSRISHLHLSVCPFPSPGHLHPSNSSRTSLPIMKLPPLFCLFFLLITVNSAILPRTKDESGYTRRKDEEQVRQKLINFWLIHSPYAVPDALRPQVQVYPRPPCDTKLMSRRIVVNINNGLLLMMWIIMENRNMNGRGFGRKLKIG